MFQSLPFRLLAIPAFLGAMALVYVLGALLGRLRPYAGPDVIRMPGDLMGVAVLLAAFGGVAFAAYLLRIGQWTTGVAVGLIGLCWALAALNAYVILAYRLVVSEEGLAETRLFGMGWRRLAWREVTGFAPAQPGYLAFRLRSGRKFKIALMFKENLEVLVRAVERHVPSSPTSKG